jgi:hypothetical protein
MLKSLSKKITEITLPEYKGDVLYMHPVELSNLTLPLGYERWESTIKQMLSHSPTKDGIAYITIDEKKIVKGESHRRGGPHTDGNFLYGWGGSDGWLTGANGRELAREQHEAQYCAEEGGMLIVSSYAACKGWNGVFEGEPSQGGNCESIDLSKMEEFLMNSNDLYWGNSTFIHESLVIDENVNRQLVRITLPSNSPAI